MGRAHFAHHNCQSEIPDLSQPRYKTQPGPRSNHMQNAESKPWEYRVQSRPTPHANNMQNAESQQQELQFPSRCSRINDGHGPDILFTGAGSQHFSMKRGHPSAHTPPASPPRLPIRYRDEASTTAADEELM